MDRVPQRAYQRRLAALLDGLVREPRVRMIEGEICPSILHGLSHLSRGSGLRMVRPDRRRRYPRANALAVLASTIASRRVDFVFSDDDHRFG
jgi:hypothetical protein